MKKGFTLIELIFAIVIIGILAAVAVPQFSNLKQNAEAKNLIKMVKDAESAVPSSAVNMSDLENNTTYVLSDILSLSGKSIGYNSTTNDGRYDLNDTSTPASNIAQVIFDRDARTVQVTIDCDAFTDTTSEDKCADSLGVTKSGDATDEYDNTVKF